MLLQAAGDISADFSRVRSASHARSVQLDLAVRPQFVEAGHDLLAFEHQTEAATGEWREVQLFRAAADVEPVQVGQRGEAFSASPAITAGTYPDLLRAAIGVTVLPMAYLAIALVSGCGIGADDIRLAGSVGLLLAQQSRIAVITGRMSRHTQVPFGPAMRSTPSTGQLGHSAECSPSLLLTRSAPVFGDFRVLVAAA